MFFLANNMAILFVASESSLPEKKYSEGDEKQSHILFHEK